MDVYDQQPNPLAEQVGLHGAAQQGNLLANQNKQLQYQMEEVEQNLAEAQLDVQETLTRINHLIKQDVLKVNPETNVLEWFALEDSKKRVLTDEGVDRIMQVMQSYINKETLLSNFDDKTIARRMLEFSLALSALLFMKYEIYFRDPTVEECYDLLEKRMTDKLESRRMSCKMMRVEFDEEKESQKIRMELFGREEYEITKIKSETRKLNLREFEMIFTQLKALVESTHNRAWKGEERGSLRRHFNISEVIGGNQPSPQKKGGWFGWGK